MNIKGISNLSLVDWDGEVCTTLFFGLCNFRCPYCQNTPLVHNSDKLKTFTVKEVLKILKKNRNIIDAVCLSGGEPTLTNGCLEDFLLDLKNLGFKIKLDTNGTLAWGVEGCLNEGLIDYVALDVKAPLNVYDYSKATGVDISEDTLATIIQFIDFLKKSKYDYEFRTTVVPKLHTTRSIEEICRYAIAGGKRYVIQNFWNSGDILSPKFRKTKPFSDRTLRRFAKIAKPYVKDVIIRNLSRNL